LSGLLRTTFLQTERIGFGTWSAGDFGLARSLWGDDRVTRWIGGPFSDDEVKERLAIEIEMERHEGIQYWPVFRLADGEFLGCCGLRPRVGDEALEVGVHLRHAHWGRGYASEAARAVVEHAFETIGAPALFAGHHPENPVSGGILERFGFRRVADELYPPTGLFHPSYRLTGDEWRAARA
jgi:RimJ/RimL family protein N-acetyltransferase